MDNPGLLLALQTAYFTKLSNFPNNSSVKNSHAENSPVENSPLQTALQTPPQKILLQVLMGTHFLQRFFQ